MCGATSGELVGLHEAGMFGVQPTVVFEQMLLSFQGPEQLNAIVKDLRSRCDTVCFCCATESLGVFCVIFMLFFSCRIVLDMEDK